MLRLSNQVSINIFLSIFCGEKNLQTCQLLSHLPVQRFNIAAPQCCRQQHYGRIFCHHLAGSKIVAATILPAATSWLPQYCCSCFNLAAGARLWQPQYCWRQDCGSHNPAASPNIMCGAHWAVDLTRGVLCIRDSHATFCGSSAACHFRIHQV